MAKDKAKPCPFCGGASLLIEGDDQIFWYTCRSCSAEGGWAASQRGALRYWNMRQNGEKEE